MPIYQFGFIVKNRREALGLTQEDLADGICSVPTLSRIENGERRPTKDNYEMLLQRLGYSDTILYEYVDEKTMLLHDLKFKIRHAFITKNLDEAAILLLKYEENADQKSPVDRQFILLYDIIIRTGKRQVQDELKVLEKALRLTCPKYEEKRLPKLLSYEEIIILNGIAVRLMRIKEYERAISIFLHLKAVYEDTMVNIEEVLRTQPMILYNLSKCLGLAGRYTECIEICNMGIKVARETGRCVLLSQTLYNRAWSLVRRRHPGDLEEAQKSAKQAIHMAIAMQDSAAAQYAENFIRSHFPELHHWIISISG